MRSLRFLVLLAPALLAPLACESSSSPGASPTFEAGPGFEAGPVPEAGPLPDGAPAPSKGVTVTVRRGVTPQPAIRVIFHDAAGLVTSESVTDAAGKVAIATAPSMVTVLTSDGSMLAPVTFLGVEDGDNLQVATPPIAAAAGAYEVAFTAVDVPNANIFDVQTGNPSCNVTGVSPLAVPLTTACVGPANAVLVRASNAGGVVGFGFKKDVLGPVGGATVAVGPIALVPFGVTTVTATNAAGVYAELYAIANEQLSVLQPAVPADAVIATATGSVDFRTPTLFASAYQTVLTNGVGGNYTALVRREATTAPAIATLTSNDFGTALPIINPPTIALATPSRPEVAFTTPASLATADAAAVRLDAVAGGCSAWTFLIPANTATFKVPALPTDPVAAACLPSSPSIYVNEATFFDASELAGYQAAKALPISPAIGAGVPSRTRVLPATGTLRVSYYSNG